jgi:hypothetical protein
LGFDPQCHKKEKKKEDEEDILFPILCMFSRTQSWLSGKAGVRA